VFIGIIVTCTVVLDALVAARRILADKLSKYFFAARKPTVVGRKMFIDFMNKIIAGWMLLVR